MNRLRFRLWFALAASLLVFQITAAAAAKDRPMEAEGALWIADGDGVLKVGSRDGVQKLRVSADAPVLAVAVDAERKLVWLYSAGSLSAYRFSGGVAESFEVRVAGRPPSVDSPAFLAVVPEDGSVWFGIGRDLLSFDASGQKLSQVRLPADLGGLSMDQGRSVLWVAAGDRIASYDAASGAETRVLDARTPVVDLDVDSSAGRLWVARKDGLRRHGADGAELFAAPVEGLTAVAATDRGSLWVAAGPDLIKIGVSGERSLTLRPFGDDGRINKLLFDPSHRAIWVSGSGRFDPAGGSGSSLAKNRSRRLIKISASGEILAVLERGEAARPHDLALFAGSPDREPPRLSFRGKGLVEAADPDRRTILLSYADLGSGVDPASLKVRLPELGLELQCTPLAAAPLATTSLATTPPATTPPAATRPATGARCSLAAGQLPEPYTLLATVADHLGNVAEARFDSSAAKDPSDKEQGDSAEGPDGARPSGLENVSAGAGSLAGQNIPSLRGVLSEQSFLSDGNVETINTGTGNVTLSIPLGQVFSVGPHIQYQLRATHNSDAWDHATVNCPTLANGCQQTFDPVMVSLPQKGSNAGVGWEVHFGKLFEPSPPAGLPLLEGQTWPNRNHPSLDAGLRWLYVSPDGGSHYLYSLPGRTVTSGGLPVRYSKDGSQIRMLQTSATALLIEHPNGVVSQFEKTDSALGTLACGGGVGGCWRFKEQRDYYGNKVWMTYSNPTSTTELWTIQDSTTRVHRIYFRLDNAFRAGGDSAANALKLPNGDELGDLRRVVDRVEVAAAGGAVASYTFRYSIQTISRSRPHELIAPTTIRVPVLTTIEVPDSADYVLTHFTDLVKSGRVSTIQFPTQGKYQYSYGPWYFPTPCVWTYDENAQFEYSRYGISQKRHLRPDGTEIARWDYSNILYPAIAGSEISGTTCKRADHRTTFVNSPAIGGRYTQHRYFHAVTEGPKTPTVNDPIGGWQVTDAGLPFTKAIKIGGSDSDYLFLSQVIYDCTTSCTERRRKYVRYAMEWRGCSTALIAKAPGDCFQVNPVMVRERTIFYDDASKWREIKHTEHNGAGATRQSFTLDNFTGSTRQVQQTTGFTATGGTTLSENATTGYIQVGTPSGYLPTPTQAWILTPYTSKIRVDSGLTYRTDFQFNSNGSITCSRKRKLSGSESGTDLVTSYTLGATAGTNAGLPVAEVVAGGENGALSPGVCNTGGTEGTNKFTFTHTYQYSNRASTRIGTFPYRYRADIDKNTGLPSVVYNKADQQTAMVYDLLGRPTRAAPEASLGEAETLVTYTNNAGAEASVFIERKFSGTRYASEQLIFDYFGRLRREIQSIPTGLSTSANSERETVYDAAGRVTALSTVQQASTVNNVQKTTRFYGYDPFGRPAQILRADSTQELRTYKGERETQSTMAVRTSLTGTENVVTTTIYDGLGRTESVQNPEFTTVSFYDPNNQVIKVERRQGTFVQKREYGLDNRGLLAWEKHPEIGGSSTPGTMSFQPDALGNPRLRYDGLNALTHEYDGDGRLFRVKRGTQAWEEFSWANANSGTNYSKGKMTQAIRHNYPGGGTFDWAIVEKYEYRGKLGKLSNRTTQLQWPVNVGADIYGATFTQTWTYDVLGDLAQQTYPTCITTPDNGRQYCNDAYDSQAPAHTVTRTNNQRLTVRVSSNLDLWADYQYHWNFEPKRTDYSNGSYTIFGLGTNNLARPASINHYKPGGTDLFATGTYSYDAAGNIWAIGADRYTYDRASRLKYGTVRTPTINETYTYDAANNLTSVARNGAAPANFNVDTNKNRMIGYVGSTPNIFYDAAGSITLVGSTAAPAFDQDYDALNMEVRFYGSSPPVEYLYAYGPGNYRIITYDVNTGTFYWTLRDLDGKVLREHRVTGGGYYVSPTQPGERWVFEKDHVHGPNGLIATRDAAGTKYFLHQDHLGTPRAISNSVGNLSGTRDYFPFGAPSTFNGVDERTAKFTGHELDRHTATYYMLARSYAHPWMRFASVDPARSGWNFYAYASNNPIGRIDPTGRADESVTSAEAGVVVSLAGGLLLAGGLIASGVGAPAGIVTAFHVTGILATGAGGLIALDQVTSASGPQISADQTYSAGRSAETRITALEERKSGLISQRDAAQEFDEAVQAMNAGSNAARAKVSRLAFSGSLGVGKSRQELQSKIDTISAAQQTILDNFGRSITGN